MFPILLILGLAAISLAFRTDVCIRKHEEFSLCAWRCPPTCVNMKLLSLPGIYCPYRWECRVGCRCSAGYIRDEYSKDCVDVTDCPVHDKCPKGQALGINLQCIERRHSILTDMSHWGDYPTMDTPWPHYYKKRPRHTKATLKLPKNSIGSEILEETPEPPRDSKETINDDAESNKNSITDWLPVDYNLENDINNKTPLKYIKGVKGKSKTKRKPKARMRLKEETESKWMPTRKRKTKFTNITKVTTQVMKNVQVTTQTSRKVDTKWKPTKKIKALTKTKLTSTKKENSPKYIIESSDKSDSKWKPTKKKKNRIKREYTNWRL